MGDASDRRTIEDIDISALRVYDTLAKLPYNVRRDLQKLISEHPIDCPLQRQSYPNRINELYITSDDSD